MNSNNPARNEGESFEAYKARRKEMKAVEKAVRQGTLFHDSYNIGTYYNPEKRAEQAARKARGIRK